MARVRHQGLSPMDFLWPVIHAFLGLLVLFVVLLLLFFISLIIPSQTLTGILRFFWTNMLLIFLASVAMSYAASLARKDETLAVVSPFLSAIGATLVVYFVMRLFDLLVPVGQFQQVTGFVLGNLIAVFLIILALGYLAFFAKRR